MRVLSNQKRQSLVSVLCTLAIIVSVSCQPQSARLVSYSQQLTLSASCCCPPSLLYINYAAQFFIENIQSRSIPIPTVWLIRALDAHQMIGVFLCKKCPFVVYPGLCPIADDLLIVHTNNLIRNCSNYIEHFFRTSIGTYTLKLSVASFYHFASLFVSDS